MSDLDSMSSRGSFFMEDEESIYIKSKKNERKRKYFTISEYRTNSQSNFKFIGLKNDMPIAYFVDNNRSFHMVSISQTKHEYDLNRVAYCDSLIGDTISCFEPSIKDSNKFYVGSRNAVYEISMNITHAINSNKDIDLFSLINIYDDSAHGYEDREPAASFFTSNVRCSLNTPYDSFSLMTYNEYETHRHIVDISTYGTECKLTKEVKKEFLHSEEVKKLDRIKESMYNGMTSEFVKDIDFGENGFYSIYGNYIFNWNGDKCKCCFGDGYPLLSLSVAKRFKGFTHNELAVVGSAGGSILIFDHSSQKPNVKIKVDRNSFSVPVNKVKFSHTVPYLFATTCESSIKLWDLRNVTLPFLVLKDHSHLVNNIDFSHHRSDTLLSSSLDKSINIWNINNQASENDHLVHKIHPPCRSFVTNLRTGYNRVDSFLYIAEGCANFCSLKEKIFENVIPYKFSSDEDRSIEKLRYFGKTEKLYKKLKSKGDSIFKNKLGDGDHLDYKHLDQLLDLVAGKNDILESDKDICKVGRMYDKLIPTLTYYGLNIPNNLTQQVSPDLRGEVSSLSINTKLKHSICQKDFEAFCRKINSSAFDYSKCDIDPELIIEIFAQFNFKIALTTFHNNFFSNKKIDHDKCISMYYFLFYPTIFDDINKPYTPYSQKPVDEKSFLKMLQRDKISNEIDYLKAYWGAVGSYNGKEHFFVDFHTFEATYISMFTIRTLLNMYLTNSYFFNCFSLAFYVINHQNAHESNKRQIKKWINDVPRRIIEKISENYIGGQSAENHKSALFAMEMIRIFSLDGLDNVQNDVPDLYNFLSNSVKKYITWRAKKDEVFCETLSGLLNESNNTKNDDSKFENQRKIDETKFESLKAEYLGILKNART